MLAALSISPSGVGESVGDYVAEAVRVVRDSGLPYETNAMFTNIEGSWDEIAAVVDDCIRRLEDLGAPRVGIVLKIDHRPGQEGMLESKRESVQRRLADEPG